MKFNARYHYVAIQQGLKAIAVQARKQRSIASALMDARIRDNLQQRETASGVGPTGRPIWEPNPNGGSKELDSKLFGKFFSG